MPLFAQAEAFIPWIPALAGVLSFLLLLGWMRSMRLKRLIEDIPTSKVQGVFIGLVELKGTAESEGPLQSFLAEVPCVHYSWSVNEHWSRTVTESYTDSEGKSQTRTKTESGWTQVAGGADSQAFYLKDDTGVILVHPEGAKIEGQSVFSHTCGMLDPLYYGKGPTMGVMDSTGTRSFTETAIPLHAAIYLMGQARERADIVAPEIAADRNASLFLISTRSEEQVLKGHGCALWAWGFFGLLIAVGGLALRDGIQGQEMARTWPWWLVPAGGFFIALMFAWIWQVYNSMVDLRNRVNRAWSLIDIELKRRADLIPPLIQCVSGFKQYEANTQKTLAALRTEAGSGNEAHGLSRPLIALAEAYPDLKANSVFLRLMNELKTTEDRLALARGFYNEAAAWQNTRYERFPEGWVATLAGYQPRKLWTAEDFERAPVVVQLAE